VYWRSGVGSAKLPMVGERRRCHGGGRGPAAVASEWYGVIGVEQFGLAVWVGMEPWVGLCGAT